MVRQLDEQTEKLLEENVASMRWGSPSHSRSRVTRQCFQGCIQQSLRYLTTSSPSLLLESLHRDSTELGPRQAHLEHEVRFVQSEMTTTQTTRGSNRLLARGHQVHRQSRRNRDCQSKEQAFCPCLVIGVQYVCGRGACKTVQLIQTHVKYPFLLK